MAAPTYNDILTFSASVQGICGAARNDFLKLAREVDFSDWSLAAKQLRATIEALMDEYGLAASEMGAQWYEYCRSLNFPDNYTARVSEANRNNLIHDANEEIDKLFEGKTGEAKLVRSLSNVVSDTVYAHARETIFENLDIERSSPYAQGSRSFRDKCGCGIVTAPNACAFCVILASRGFVYKTSDISFHDHCKCVAVPFCDTREISGYDEVLAAHREKYDAAEELRRSGNYPIDLQKQIDDAKAEHEGKWSTINETAIIMRYQNEGMV